MYSVGTVCTTRFCHSERKVLNRYAGNLVFIILDMETVRMGETGITQQVLKIKSVTFVVHLFGVIDLLRPLKNLSLAMQAVRALALNQPRHNSLPLNGMVCLQVNVLPWEQNLLITVFLADLELLESDLRNRKLDRLLDSVDSRGNSHAAFEYLARHKVRLKQLTLELDDKQTGQGLIRVKLTESSARWVTRGRANFTNPLDEFNSALDDLADLTHDMHTKINARLMNTQAEERWVRRMETALDLKVMAYPMSAAGLTAVVQLDLLSSILFIIILL